MTEWDKKNLEHERQTEEARRILMEELHRLEEGAKHIGTHKTLAEVKMHADIAQSMAKVAEGVARCRNFFPVEVQGFVADDEAKEDE